MKTLRLSLVVQGAVFAALCLVVSAPAAPVPRDPPAKRAMGTREGGRMQSVLTYDDATKARGGAASGGSAEAVVFDQPNDSGFGWFMKSDDVFGYGTWAAEMIFANGFSAGDSVSSYMMRFYHSSFDDIAGLGGNDAEVSTQLWNGDPFSIMDTGCTVAGVSAPIPGTAATFTGIPWATVVDLTAVLPDKPVVDCDRVWGEMTLVRGCRGSWRLSGGPGGVFNVPAFIGSMNAAWLLWACEQFIGCNTANGLNSGFCCNDPGTTCDHTDDVFECDVNGTEPGGLPSFCGDGAADYFVADYHLDGVFEGYVATVSATANVLIQIVPVSVDAPTMSGDPPNGLVSLSGNDVVLEDGDHNIWLEFRIGDWDPEDTGVQLAAWQLTYDASGQKSGVQGALTAYVGSPCPGPGVNASCIAELGPGALCDPPGYFYPPGTCALAFIDQTRPDYVYADAGVPIVTIDL